MKTLFLDESGDHNLSIIQTDYPIFALGGIIVENDYADGVMVDIVNQFKQDLFGTTDIILHTADITRNRNGFEKLIEPQFRKQFYDKLNALMRNLDYMIVACVIKKSDHLARYGIRAFDPYQLSLEILVERFCFEIGADGDEGHIVAERRDPLLDAQLELAWLNLKITGTQYIEATKVDNRIQGMTLRKKKDNIAGLQIADLVVSPIGRHVLGKVDREDFRIIEKKFRRSWSGNYQGYGLVIMPR